jgi:hypothetical protein
MQTVRNVFAFANLAERIRALASVIKTATTKLELQIGANNQEPAKQLGRKGSKD